MKDDNPSFDDKKDGKKAGPAAEGDAAPQAVEKAVQRPDDSAELKERMLRLAAEFDNYKKRTMKDIGDAKELGKAEMLKSMLNIVDEFDLMLVSAVKSDDKALAKGVELLYSNFMDALKRNGLREIEATGKFDPYRHEIMMVREEDGKEDGHILEVIKKGYALNDRMLRPAAVIVARPKAQEAEGGKGEHEEDE